MLTEHLSYNSLCSFVHPWYLFPLLLFISTFCFLFIFLEISKRIALMNVIVLAIKCFFSSEANKWPYVCLLETVWKELESLGCYFFQDKRLKSLTLCIQYIFVLFVCLSVISTKDIHVSYESFVIAFLVFSSLPYLTLQWLQVCFASYWPNLYCLYR